MKPFALLLSGVKKQTANRFDRPTFASDDSAHIARPDSNFDFHISAIGNFRYLDRIGITDQRFDNFFNGFLHNINENRIFQTLLFGWFFFSCFACRFRRRFSFSFDSFGFRSFNFSTFGFGSFFGSSFFSRYSVCFNLFGFGFFCR